MTAVQRRAAVLGSPIGHSKSPALHRAAYAAAGLDWRYDAIDVGSGAALEAFLAALGPRWVGLSLTMPLKEPALALVDVLDPVARATGAVNTIVLPGAPTHPPGSAGHNTDVVGIVDALAEAGVTAAGTVAVLGAGGTARSAVAAAAQLGAQVVQVYARRPEAASEVAALADVLGSAGHPRAWAQVGDCVGADLVISTVPAGVADAVAGAVAGPPAGTLLDVVYHPWPTPLAAAWGAAVVPGIAMLLWQAVAQVRLMAGIEPDVAAMKAAVGL